jgi:hypothetical protein
MNIGLSKVDWRMLCQLYCTHFYYKRVKFPVSFIPSPFHLVSWLLEQQCCISETPVVRTWLNVSWLLEQQCCISETPVIRTWLNVSWLLEQQCCISETPVIRTWLNVPWLLEQQCCISETPVIRTWLNVSVPNKLEVLEAVRYASRGLRFSQQC